MKTKREKEKEKERDKGELQGGWSKTFARSCMFQPFQL